MVKVDKKEEKSGSPKVVMSPEAAAAAAAADADDLDAVDDDDEVTIEVQSATVNSFSYSNCLADLQICSLLVEIE